MKDLILNRLSDNLGLVTLAFFALMSWLVVAKQQSHSKRAKKILDKAIKTQMNEPLTLHPEIDPAKCLGCGTCTTVCPEGDILQLINHRAVLVAASKCVGHGECERACPFGAISLVFGTKTRGVDLPRLTKDYETNVPGLYIAGELGGMGLIRNAIKQGHLAAHHALTALQTAAGTTSRSSDVVDLLIVGAGPAGLAAALTAIAEKKSYVLIEQNSFGGTVANFPRQKVVMSHPARLPVVGEMKFKHNHAAKEEVLEYWNRIRAQTGLKVREKVKFEGLEPGSGHFVVKTSQGPVAARKVILAMGVRGSPRRLGLPNEDLPKVAYNLLDPDEYRDMDIVVVGGGNAGVEAAQALAHAKRGNRVTLLVRGPRFDRCNQENIDIITRMEAQGLVKIWFDSSVKEIQSDQLIVTKQGAEARVANHYLFIFAGAELPSQFLMSLGVKFERMHGQALQTA